MNIYLAGPFFNTKERENIEKARDILREKGLAVFVPMEHVIANAWELSNEEWGRKVFDMDKEAIYDCDVMVALYYGLYSDSGTAWEIGFANSLNKKIIIVHCDVVQESSLMVVNGSSVNIPSIDDLKNINFNNIGQQRFLTHTTQK